MKRHEGPDFDVVYFSDTSTKSTMGLYAGDHPSLRSREASVAGVQRRPGRVGDISVEWSRWSQDDRHRSETLVRDNGKRLKVKTALRAGKKAVA